MNRCARYRWQGEVAAFVDELERLK